MPKKAPPRGAFSTTDGGRFSWENRDCAVRAVSAALGEPYKVSHAKLKAAGRKDKRGTYAHQVTAATGLRAEFGRDHTYAQWLREHPVGTYIVFVRGHFFAVINGRQLDMGASLYRPRKRLHYFWRVA